MIGLFVWFDLDSGDLGAVRLYIEIDKGGTYDILNSSGRGMILNLSMSDYILHTRHRSDNSHEENPETYVETRTFGSFARSRTLYNLSFTDILVQIKSFSSL